MFSLNFNINKFTADLDKIADNIEQKVLNEGALAIREAIVEEVVNQQNWNPQAVYSPKSVQSGKYDLILSGQLLSAISDPSRNIITSSRSRAKIGVGNINFLDALRSKREAYGSGGSVSARSKNAPYWKFVVWGHSAPKGNFAFKRGTPKDGKDVGDIVRTDDYKEKMRGTPPTYMFENGWMMAQSKIRKIMRDSISEAMRN